MLFLVALDWYVIFGRFRTICFSFYICVVDLCYASRMLIGLLCLLDCPTSFG